jgi:rod shape-determining protein MreD
MKPERIFLYTILIALAGVLQSTVFYRFTLFYAVPDLALVILLFAAYEHGVMAGQLTGFIAGVALDFLSASPLGMHVFLMTIIGAASGLLKGNLVLDRIFLPALFAIAATLAKALLLFLLHFLFSGAVPAYSLTAPTLWFELLLNMIAAPLLFALLNSITRLFSKRAKGLSKR